MNILITGGTGLVGSNLVKKLEKNHKVFILSRQKNYDYLIWNGKNILNPGKFPEKFDVVVNLMGENLANKRWSDKQKEKIIKSRVDGTKNLIKTLSQNNKMPKKWIQASAIGIYNKNSHNIFDETSPIKSHDFLSEVCCKWEEVIPKDIKNYIVRIGLVLSKEGGLLKKIEPIFKLNGGSKLSDGQQFMSVIHLDDLTDLFVDLIENDYENKIINGVSTYCSNQEFTSSLCNHLNKFEVPIGVPSFMLKMLMGEMSVLALDSQKVTSSYNNFKYDSINKIFEKEYSE